VKPLFEQQKDLKNWPRYQQTLNAIPPITCPLEEWDDPDLLEEYLQSYSRTRRKVLEAQPGQNTTDKLESHCFFATDGTKHFVSRLHTKAHERINEIRFRRNGQLIRLSYEREDGELQNLDELMQLGLLGIENDQDRFARYPGYILRVLLFTPQGGALKSVYRGIGFYEEESDGMVMEEEGEGTC
jgi:hypothetical protein